MAHANQTAAYHLCKIAVLQTRLKATILIFTKTTVENSYLETVSYSK